jgi:hypothetical protein
MMDAQKGMHRKVVIPGPLGFGAAGELRGKVPANATLYVDMEVVDVAPGAPGDAQGNANPGLQPVDPNSPEMKKLQEAMQKQLQQKAAGGAPATPTPVAPPPKR